MTDTLNNQKNKTSNPVQQAHSGKTSTSFDGLTFEVIEEEERDGKPVVSRGVYLLPNLVTTLSLFSAFVSILASTSGKLKLAIVCIVASGFLDGLDGRIARMLNAQSPFGEQFDSLADMLAFGVAPAFLVYTWALDRLGRIGIACAFVFIACAAFRLARFNVQIGTVSKKYFVGLASPLAAALVTSLVILGVDRPHWLPSDAFSTQVLAAVWVVMAGLLMVSNLRYFSFKEFNKKRVPFAALIAIVFMIGLFINDLPIGLLTLTCVYALSGMWTTFFSKQNT